VKANNKSHTVKCMCTLLHHLYRNLCIYICVCIYVDVCVYVYTPSVCMCACTYVCICGRINHIFSPWKNMYVVTHICISAANRKYVVCVSMYMYVCACVCAYMEVCVCICGCLRMYIYNMYVYIFRSPLSSKEYAI